MNNSRIKQLTIVVISSLLMTAFSQQSLAQNEGRWYNVELLIFKRLNPSSLTAEFWPQDLSLYYPEELQFLSEQTTNNIQLKKNFLRLSRDVFTLNNHAESLRRDNNYEVLYHQAWQQQMQSKENSPSIAIEGGKRIGNSQSQSHSELEGFITLHIARYLHINTNLWLSDPKIAKLQGAANVSSLPNKPLYGFQEAKNLEQSLLNDRTPGQTLSERIGERLSRNTEILLEGKSIKGELNTNSTNAYNSQGIVALTQHRRMRSKELHYIDHPMMGILIYFNPIP